MKLEKEYIEELLERFFDGQTTEIEEQQLAEYFHDAETIPEEWSMYKDLFGSFMTDAYDFSQDELDVMLSKGDGVKSNVAHLLSWVSVACVVVIVGLCVWCPWGEDSISEVPSITHVVPVEDITRIDIAEAKYTTSKHDEKIIVPPRKDIANNSVRPIKHTVRPVESQEITTSELLETIKLLVDVGNENITITSLPDNGGFVVRTVSYEGESNSYTLRRCAESSSLELKSQVINF